MISFRYFFIAISFLALIGGCTTRVMTKEEKFNATSRVYQNLQPTEIYTAAGDLFFLADEVAFQVETSPAQLVATRIYGLGVLVDGTDTWTLTAEKISEGTLATLDVKSQATWVSGKTESNEPAGPATYDLFWQRLNYLLKQSPQWMTCEDLNLAYLRKETWGDTLWLCDGFADQMPPNLTNGVWQRGLGEPLTQEDLASCTQDVNDEVYGQPKSALQRHVYLDRCLQQLGYTEVGETQSQN